MNDNQFQYRMGQLPEPTTTLTPPYWEAWRLDLWRRVQTQNPSKFWQWPCIYHTMLVNHWPDAIKAEFLELEAGYKRHCSIPHFGPDDPLIGTQLSMNLIHQAYHIQQWEQASGQRINRLDTIVEFGSGYGAMALLCSRMGFDGKYIIYDLPEFSLLQEYYLSQFGLLDKVSWNPARKSKDVDLFMALYSISEVPLLERAKKMVRAKSYLFLYSGLWEGWNNVEWFRQFAASTVLEWRHSEIETLPDRNNWYSIGW